MKKEYEWQTACKQRARYTYSVFRKDFPTAPPWKKLPLWTQNALGHAYLQGRLDGGWVAQHFGRSKVERLAVDVVDEGM